MTASGATPHHPKHGEHLVHSHAHEGDIPGTVDLRAVDGDDTAYGQALFPVPAEDPNDPLQWSSFKKTMILIICCTYSFLGNAFLTGVSPYITLWSETFDVTATQASGLISYPNLGYGFGSLILIPLYLKFGRRPVMLGSMLLFVAGVAGSSQATSYTGLMVGRVFASIGSGVCEAIPVQLVNDIFFLHERGKRLGFYTVALCLGAVSPLPASHMLIQPWGWRLYFYVVLAFSLAVLILAFFFVEETSYDRNANLLPTTPSEELSGAQSDEKSVRGTVISVPERKSFVKTLEPWGRFDPQMPFFMTMARSFTYFLVPQALWVITSFGIYVGLGGFAFNYTFPIKIMAEPYNWSEASSGLSALATLIGYILAVPFASTSDLLAARLTRRNGGIREAEMRLGVILPAMLVAPAGLILYGITAQNNLHWMGYFVGIGMLQWSSYFYFSFALAYAIDSHSANMSEMLIAINLGKQAISFGLSVDVLDWVLENGYAVIISGVFCAVCLANNLFVIVFMIWGKRIRTAMATSWLARLHRRHAGGTHEVA